MERIRNSNFDEYKEKNTFFIENPFFKNSNKLHGLEVKAGEVFYYFGKLYTITNNGKMMEVK